MYSYDTNAADPTYIMYIELCVYFLPRMLHFDYIFSQTDIVNIVFGKRQYYVILLQRADNTQYIGFLCSSSLKHKKKEKKNPIDIFLKRLTKRKCLRLYA